MKLPPSADNADFYRNPDGSFTAVLAARPIRRKTALGWQDLNGRLMPSSSPGFALAYQGRAGAFLPASAAGWSSVARDGRSVAFALAGGSSAAGLAQADGRSIRFTDALPGIDLALTATPEGGIKESLVLKSPAAAPWNGEFHYRLQLTGLDAAPVTDDSGSHILLSAHGTANAAPLLQIAPPHAVDAGGSRTDDCWYNLADDHRSLDLVVDPNWLKTAVYPVTIDPTITNQPDATTGQDTYVASGTGYSTNYGTDTQLVVGDSGTVSDGVSFLRFNLSSVAAGVALPPGSSITSASLNVTVLSGASEQVDVYQATQPWDQATLTKSNAGENLTGPAYLFSQTVDPSNSATWSLSVTNAVTNWFNGSSRNFGFILSPHVSPGAGLSLGSSDNTTQANRPALVINYTLGNDPANNAYAGPARGWGASAALNPYQSLNVQRGNVLTRLPITGWGGFGPGVQFTLVHNSNETQNWANVAPKWTDNYNEKLTFNGGSITLTRGDGRRDTFTGSGPTYTSPTGVFDVLAQSGSSFTLTHPNQMVETFDGTGKLISIVEPISSTGGYNAEVDLGYDGSGRLITVQDANPVATNRRTLTLHYNTYGQMDTITDPLGRVWTLVYSGTSESTSDLIAVQLPHRTDGVNDSLADQYVFAYNGYHDVTGIGEPDQNTVGNTATYVYSTEYDYYDRGTASLGRSGLTFRGMYGVYVSYPSYPSPGTVDLVDQTWVTHKITFGGPNGDEMTQKLAVNDPTVAEANWTGPTTVFEYDSQSDRIGERLPGNPSTVGGSAYWSYEWSYDTGNANQGSRGNLLTAVQHVLNSDNSTENLTLKQATSYTYDTGGHNRVTQETSTETGSPNIVNHVTQYTYDGNPTSGWVKLTSVKRYDDNDPLWAWTESYAYYPDGSYPGKVQTRTDGNGNGWNYQYDGWGNLTQETSPGTTNRTTSFTFDATAHVLPVTKTDNMGQVFTTSYHTTGTNPDWRSTQTSVNTSGTPTNYFYWTANGQDSGQQNFISGDPANPRGNEVDKTYTDGGVVTQEDEWYTPTNAEVHFFYYDGMGRMTSRGYGVNIYQNGINGSRGVDYAYDKLGRLSSKTWDSGGYLPDETITYAYDATTGLLTTQSYPNSTQTLFSYDSLGAETQRQHQHLVSGSWVGIGTYSVTRRADGLVMYVDGTGGTAYNRSLFYDPIGEMSEEDLYAANGITLLNKQYYTYDMSGNRTERDEYDGSGNYLEGEGTTYDAGNQLATIQLYGANRSPGLYETFGTGNGFDANGNMLAPPDGTRNRLTYYPTNQVKTMTDPAIETSCYYPNGQISKRGTVYSEYDLGQRTQDMDSSVETWGPPTTIEYADRDLTIYYSYATGGNQPTGVSFSWQLTDSLGNVVLVTDSSGTVTDTLDQGLNGTNATDNGLGSTQEFQYEGGYGYSYRGGSGLMQVGARVYDPAQGRFMQQDPLSFGQGDWTYAADSPGNAVDPSGMSLSRPEVGSGYAVGGAAVTVTGGVGVYMAGCAFPEVALPLKIGLVVLGTLDMLGGTYFCNKGLDILTSEPPGNPISDVSPPVLPQPPPDWQSGSTVADAVLAEQAGDRALALKILRRAVGLTG